MKKLKYPIKKKRSQKVDLSKYTFDNPYRPKKIIRIIFYTLIILIPVFLTYVYLRSSIKLNKEFSFPLDDPWIHLTFAKNLAEYFSFSYFKNEMVTAGSTSPLYTIIVAIAFFISSNEMIISYVLGILFLVGSVVAFYRLSSFEFQKEHLFAMVCTGIFILDKWMNFIAVSGMETTMFILLLLLCGYFYKKKEAIPFAVMLGLIMWTRPDGVAFIGAVIVDYLIIKIVLKDSEKVSTFSASDIKIILLIFGGILGLYFLMNYLLSGSLLPNTYNAKLTYYSPEFRSRYDFLKYEVWDYFTTGSYYVLMIGFIFALLKFFYDLYNRNFNQNTIYILFILSLVFIYWLKLPYAHRFGRYMMPIIPFFVLVSVIGFRDFARFINRYTTNVLFAKSIFYILIGITFFIGVKDYDLNRELYVTQSKYIFDRQVSAAKWIKESTNDSAVIATHDVGAIGFYSGRKIIDVAGLVTPELISKINDLNYVNYMKDYMNKNGVTHLAFLREWYRVSNQKPLFTTVYRFGPEVMEVYEYFPNKTKILSREANSLLMNAQSLLGQKAGQQIIFITNRLLAMEPDCSEAYYLRGYAYYLNKDFQNYEKNIKQALELFPQNYEAQYYFGEYLMSNNRYAEAKPHIEKYLELDPENEKMKNFLSQIQDTISTGKITQDTLK
ncbi:MAG: hypothetical protein HGGPFJEG_02738 [Ignavibacteria bacterium]|nr:hypothetical protein [Ignavibacteria bacterium]